MTFSRKTDCFLYMRHLKTTIMFGFAQIYFSTIVYLSYYYLITLSFFIIFTGKFMNILYLNEYTELLSSFETAL